VDRELALGNHSQRTRRQAAFRFNRHVGIVHRAGADGPLDALAAWFLAHKSMALTLTRMSAKFSIRVARTPRIAIDTLVLAAPAQIHVVLDPEPGIWLLDRR
jgi:hypothetical protein